MTVAYEQRLSSDLHRASMKGSMLFKGHGAVYSALEKNAKRFIELSIPYAGAMAAFANVFRRWQIQAYRLSPSPRSKH